MERATEFGFVVLWGKAGWLGSSPEGRRPRVWQPLWARRLAAGFDQRHPPPELGLRVSQKRRPSGRECVRFISLD
jgi:hypothetical protein